MRVLLEQRKGLVVRSGRKNIVKVITSEGSWGWNHMEESQGQPMMVKASLGNCLYCNVV